MTANNETWIGSGAHRIVGPSLAAAQLYREQPFRDSPSVMHLDGSCAQKPVTRRLYALNYQLRQPPGAPSAADALSKRVEGFSSLDLPYPR